MYLFTQVHRKKSVRDLTVEEREGDILANINAFDGELTQANGFETGGFYPVANNNITFPSGNLLESEQLQEMSAGKDSSSLPSLS